MRSKVLQNLEELFRAFSDVEALVCKDVLSFDAVMVMLWLRKEPKSLAGRVSRALCFTPSKTTRCLKKLTALNLIDELLDGDDLRKCYFRLSNKGENVAFEVMRAIGKTSIEWQLACFIKLTRAASAAEKAHGGCKITRTAQRLLLALYAADDMTVCRLAEATFLSQSSTSMSLGVLRKKGLVEEGWAKADNRMRNVRLTSDGRNVVATMLLELEFLVNTQVNK